MVRVLLGEALAEYERENALYTFFARFSPHRQEWVTDSPLPFRLKAASFVWPEDDPRACSNLRDLVRDATRFFRSRTWYRERGIPFRRGYLLHGRPACGKM